MAGSKLTFNKEAWNEMLTGIVDNELVPRAQHIADACNDASVASAEHNPKTSDDEKAGYIADTDGDKPLDKHGYRATVITSTYPAMADNARNDRLVSNFYRAEGD